MYYSLDQLSCTCITEKTEQTFLYCIGIIIVYIGDTYGYKWLRTDVNVDTMYIP